MLLHSVLLPLLLTLVDCQVHVLSPLSLTKRFRESTDVSSDEKATPGADVYIPCSTATFGSPIYGESLIGRVISVPSQSNYCADDYAMALSSKFNVTRHANPNGNGLRTIFTVNRGDCSFVQKVSIAEQLGADAVIIVDNLNSNWTRRQITQVVVSDDGNGGRIRIPSVLLTSADGVILQEFASKPENMVLISMEWSIPQLNRGDKVIVDFWTSSGSIEGTAFLARFAPAIKALNDHVTFNSHYYIYGLNKPNSTAIATLPNSSNDQGVVNIGGSGEDSSLICIDKEFQFCAPTSDRTRRSGRLVIEEDLRQLCLFRVTQIDSDALSHTSRMSPLWWAYMEAILSENLLYDLPVDQETSLEIMSKLLQPLSNRSASLQAIKNCVVTDWQDVLMRERNSRAWSLLALRINGARFNGNLDPEMVVRGICTGLQQKEALEACDDAIKAIGVSRGDLIPPPLSHHQGVTAGQFLFFAVIVLGVMACGFAIYQRGTQNALRTALRREVVMEVKSQMQQHYYKVEDVVADRSRLLLARASGPPPQTNLKEAEFQFLNL